MLTDRFNRNINYLRVSLTQECNLNCTYCSSESDKPNTKRDFLTLKEIETIVKAAAGAGIDKVRITGGEPLLREGIIAFVYALKNDIGIKDLSMTTNGLLLPRHAKNLKSAGLDRLNVSLDTTDPSMYAAITRGGDVSAVIAGLDAAKSAGFAGTKINSVLLQGVTEQSVPDLIDLCHNETNEGLAEEIRFIELMPIGDVFNLQNYKFLPAQYIKDTLQLKAINHEPNVHFSAATMYMTESGTKVGLITAMSDKFCNSCNRIRLTADGRLKPCLLCDTELDVLDCVRTNPHGLQELLAFSVRAKPRQHNADCNVGSTKRTMIRTGG